MLLLRDAIGVGEPVIGVAAPQESNSTERQHDHCDYQEAFPLPLAIISRHSSFLLRHTQPFNQGE
jgi:hypothetical protein